MALTLGMLLFDDVEELDFVGPWEVFASLAQARDDLEVFTVAERGDTVRCAKGLRVLPDRTLDQVTQLDVVLVPGGQGTRREVERPELVEWLRKIGPGTTWTTSVCTGSLLLCEAGLTQGRRVTTHWNFVETLRARYPDVEVLADVRYVRDGSLVTAAGVSAGIDMALWLAGQLYGVDVARTVRRYIEYDPAPPYLAEV
ncbi:MAG: DJ-1/PfpI family protein [Myxococcota bacterium]